MNTSAIETTNGSEMLLLNNLDFRGSVSDGPGVRNVIFFQGCDRIRAL